jgi:hypothetical protein
MRKQARRLWLGDWQRDHEQPSAPDPEPTNTVVIEPDHEDAPEAVDGNRGVSTVAFAAAIIVALIIFTALLSSTSSNPLTAVIPPATPQAQQQVPPIQIPQSPQGVPPQGFGAPDVTGSAAERAAQAAVRRFPGSVERVTHDSTGSGYIVHVIQGDGNEVHVLVGPDFHVQGSDAGSAPPTFGSGTGRSQ